MTELLMNWGPWHWVAVALILFSLEMMVGTFDLLWIATAALIAAAFSWLAPVGLAGWPAETAVFAIASVALVVAGRTVFSGMRKPPTSHPDLNDRIAKMVGKAAVVSEAFTGGRGRVKFGDTEWAAEAESGEDLFAGQKVTITGGTGSMVNVKTD